MDRDRLNERPIILRSNLFVLAFAETVEHFYNDFSQAWVQLPQADNIGSKPLDPETPPELILKNAPRWLSVGKWTAITTPIITFVLLYPLLLRGYAWSWSLWFARLIWDVPRSAEPPLIPPYHYTVIFRAFTSSFLLVCLWELTNLSFGAFVGQPPVKRGKPLTADSRDPNGSLLNGLNSKKNLVKVRIILFRRGMNLINCRRMLFGNYTLLAPQMRHDARPYFPRSIAQMRLLGSRSLELLWPL